MKRIIENQITRDVVQVGEDGAIKNQEHEEITGTKIIHTQEPPYIKIYLQDILYMNDIPKNLNCLTYSLLKRSSYANDEEGLCVTLAQYTKTKILKECGWEKMQSLNNALNKLVKGNIIKRLGTGVYQFNPYLFGRGEWKDIERIRITWDYDKIKGKTFSSEFNYKTDNTEENE